MDDEIVEHAQESTESPQETVSTPEPPKIDQAEVERKAEELYQARNFKQLREQAEAIARENQELKKQLSTASKQSLTLGENEIAEGKHLASQKAYIDEKIEKQQQQLAELMIRTQCPDFDKVVTSENLQKLAQEYPELAVTINSSPDFQAKAISAYKLIKKFEIYNPQLSQDKETIMKNLNKPKPSNILPKQESDLSRANAFEKGMTDAEKEAKFKQMREWARQA